jgi:hypothetical protein
MSMRRYYAVMNHRYNDACEHRLAIVQHIVITICKHRYNGGNT